MCMIPSELTSGKCELLSGNGSAYLGLGGGLGRMVVGEGHKDAQGRLWLMAVFAVSLTRIVLGVSTPPVVYFKRVQVILCRFISVRMLKRRGAEL